MHNIFGYSCYLAMLGKTFTFSKKQDFNLYLNYFTKNYIAGLLSKTLHSVLLLFSNCLKFKYFYVPDKFQTVM